MLRTSTPHYAAQPYQQLAAAVRAAGHDDEQRTILIAQRAHQTAGGDLSGPAKAWARFTGATLGYGYRTHRMALALLAIIALALVATFTLAGNGATTAETPATATTAAAARDCTPTEHAGYALDAALPLVKTTLTGTCTTTPTATGTALAWTAAAVLELLAGPPPPCSSPATPAPCAAPSACPKLVAPPWSPCCAAPPAQRS